MAVIVSDDHNIVNTSSVVAVYRPTDDLATYLLVTAAGCPQVTCWFQSIDARDTYYKELLEGMTKT